MMMACRRRVFWRSCTKCASLEKFQCWHPTEIGREAGTSKHWTTHSASLLEAPAKKTLIRSD